MVKQGTSKVKFMQGTKKVKALMLGTQKIWSGASVVSYYDGDTLIGINEIDEGQDVLHPSFDTSKTGYTLYGWGTTSGATERVESLIATGEPMTLYAIYLPNTLTAYLAHFNQYGQYVVDVRNASYVSGTFGVSVTASWNSQTKEVTFNLSKGKYNTATGVFQGRFTAHDVGAYMSKGDFKLDGTTVFDAVGSQTIGSQTRVINSGSHKLRVYAIAYSDYNQTGGGYVISINLTNPIAWV